MAVGEGDRVLYDGDAGRLPEARGDAEAVGGAAGEGELEAQRDAEALRDGD